MECHDAAQMACIDKPAIEAMNTLFRTKNPDHLIAEAATPERQMKRVLGPFALTCIGIGAIIGTGIFAWLDCGRGRAIASVGLENSHIEVSFNHGRLTRRSCSAGPVQVRR
jgi:amino acid permease